MINLQKKIKYILTFLTVCLLVGVIFIGSGYLYLSYQLKPTEIKEETVPYYSTVPDNAGVMFDICADRILCYMDFEKNLMNIVFDSKNIQIGENLYGYPVDYMINGNYDLISYLVDAVGGIEMETEEEILRFTGVQIEDMLSRTAETEELYREIIPEILKKVYENGLEKEDFLYIIENSETNLTMPDCYYWPDYIKSLCKNAIIVN